MKLKKIIRRGVLETNSSSSHSVCISRGDEVCKPGDGAWDLDLREDGTLYIPSPSTYFGRDLFKSNKCLTKLQYAFGLAYSCCPEKQHELTELVKRVTGAKNVIFEWVEDYKRKVEEHHGLLKDIYVEVPEIDHQSLDLYEEVFEDENTLKEFIFNPKSWLYGGSDESEDPTGFRDEWLVISDKEDDVILKIHLGGEIGDIDILTPELLTEGASGCEKEVVEDDRIVGLYVDDKGELHYLKGLDIWRRDLEYKAPILVKDGDSIALAVLPLGKKSVEILSQLPRLNAGLLTVEDIISSGIQYNVPGGFKTYPITIISKMYGKLC